MHFVTSLRLIGAVFIVALGFSPATAHANDGEGVTPVTIPSAPSLTVPTLTVPTLVVPQVSPGTSGASGAGSLTVPTITVPQLQVPTLGSPGAGTVTVPTITVPQLQVPTLTAPSLTVPQLQVPSLTVPPLVAPEMPVIVVPEVADPETASTPTSVRRPRGNANSGSSGARTLPQGGLIAPEVLLEMLQNDGSNSGIELTPPQEATSARRLPIGTFAAGGGAALLASFALSAVRRRRETLAGEIVE
jgi:hypothetical protein